VIAAGQVLEVVRAMGFDKVTDYQVAIACGTTINEVGPALFYLQDTGHLKRHNGYWHLLDERGRVRGVMT
jgi:hypothetical protein